MAVAAGASGSVVGVRGGSGGQGQVRRATVLCCGV